ncbi:MAG: hypothetical protein KUG82_22415 [Pseudomonadales bacterium]|nr:hypothetical protein [Pseudomonadales bacterium]
MEISSLIEFLFRWGHFLFGITWIGMLYYFNFVQGEYFKEAEPSAKSDAVKKLAPRALWWFRWGAAGTFITGIALFGHMLDRANPYIYGGMLMGTFMFLNVWIIIWPAQKIVCGIVEGDAGVAGPKALLASRTNTLLSGPMLFFMGASTHLGGTSAAPLAGNVGMGFIAIIALIIAVEANGLFGKLGPIATVKGVIHASLGLTAVMYVLSLI